MMCSLGITDILMLNTVYRAILNVKMIPLRITYHTYIQLNNFNKGYDPDSYRGLAFHKLG